MMQSLWVYKYKALQEKYNSLQKEYDSLRKKFCKQCKVLDALDDDDVFTPEVKEWWEMVGKFGEKS